MSPHRALEDSEVKGLIGETPDFVAFVGRSRRVRVRELWVFFGDGRGVL